MEENGRKWKEMGKSMVDVQIEGVFSIDPSKLRYRIQNEDRSIQGYRYRYKDHPKSKIQIQVKIDQSKDTDTDTKITLKLRYRIQNEDRSLQG